MLAISTAPAQLLLNSVWLGSPITELRMPATVAARLETICFGLDWRWCGIAVALARRATRCARRSLEEGMARAAVARSA